MTMIQSNIARLKDHISLICQKIGRKPDDITLIAVTKLASFDQIQKVVRAGILHIGENKVQEAFKKYASLESQGFKVTKHMIGHLQTNKVRLALGFFDVIQSLDSLRLAEVISLEGQKADRNVNVLIQVNTSGEDQKYGIPGTEAMSFVQKVVSLAHLRILGLMTIAPFTDNEEIIRDSFRKLRILRDKIKNDFGESSRIQMKYLSMGMTSDYAIALEEGANMLRIGRAIFQ